MPLRITVDAKPGKKIASISVRNGIVVVAVRERAVDGRANVAIERALAAWLGVPTHSVSIVAGGAGRRKFVDVGNIDAALLAARLAAAESPSSRAGPAKRFQGEVSGSSATMATSVTAIRKP